MRKIPCLNLAEVMNSVYEQEGTFGNAAVRMKEESGYTRFERVYAGSSFCSQYFLHASKDMIQALCLLCEKEHIKMTLVIPVFSQKDLEKGKVKIDEFIKTAGHIMDEVTVNDYGMLSFMHKNYQKRIQIGRMLVKDYRDKRYPEYFHSVCAPKIFTKQFLTLAKQYEIAGVEIDLTHETLDLMEAPKEMVIGIHYPYCYQTVGNICEAASTVLPTEKRYRPNSPCHSECEDHIIHYHVPEAGDYVKHGRTIYFENRECNIINRSEIRLIYSPKLMEVFA